VLNALSVARYKSFPNSVTIPLGKLTVLLGRNNSGKTAIARLPLLLAGALTSESTAGSPTPLSHRGVWFANRIEDLAHGSGPHGRFEIGADFGTDSPLGRLDMRAEVQLRSSTRSETSAFVANLRLDPVLVRPLQWAQGLFNEDPDYGAEGRLKFVGLLPVLSDKRGAQIDELRMRSRRFSQALIHLLSVRTPIQTVYEDRDPADVVDPSGAEAPYLLNRDPALLDAVSTWYETAIGAGRLRIENSSFAFQVVQRNHTGGQTNLSHTGQGIQQVLAVATYLKALTDQTEARLVVVEEPELHLHPAAHGHVADLFVEAACNSASQLLVETHSENFVLRVRRRIAEGVIDSTKVRVLWIDSSPAGATVQEVTIRPDGSVANWPTGVFSEDVDEVRAIARAQR
jgi:AAA ATPase domain